MAGRPSKYTEDIQKKADEYIEKCIDEYKEYELNKTVTTKELGGDSYVETKKSSVHRLTVKLPSVEGLAKYINVSRAIIYKWEEDRISEEFLDTLERLREEQAERLINMGISGEYNSTIAKLLLSGHGYVEKKEVDSNVSGELKMPDVTFQIINPNDGKDNTSKTK